MLIVNAYTNDYNSKDIVMKKLPVENLSSLKLACGEMLQSCAIS